MANPLPNDPESSQPVVAIRTTTGLKVLNSDAHDITDDEGVGVGVTWGVASLRLGDEGVATGDVDGGLGSRADPSSPSIPHPLVRSTTATQAAADPRIVAPSAHSTVELHGV